MPRPARTLSLAALLIGLLPVGAALAEPSAVEQQAAQTLFDNARRLMKEGKYAEACPQLEESQRLDPGGGTLLNLAICHEKQGRLSTAHTEYQAALSQAIAAGRADRQKTARDALASLGPRLPRLRLTAREPSADLSVRLDGQPLPRATWALGTPADPGKHFLEATAPGRRPFRAEIELREGQTSELVVPPLEPEPETAPPPAAAAPPAASSLPPLPAAPGPEDHLAPVERAGGEGCRGPRGLDGACLTGRRPQLERWESPGAKTASGVIAAISAVAFVSTGTAALVYRMVASCSAAEGRCDDQASLDRAQTARTLAWWSTGALGLAAVSGVAYMAIPRRKVVVGPSGGPGAVGLQVSGVLP